MAADAKRTECPICEKDVPVNKDGTIRAHRWRADRCHASGLTIDQARDSIRGLAEVPPPTEPERGEIVQHPAPQPEGGQLVPAAGSAIDAAVTAAMAMPGMPGMDEFLSLAMQARILSMSGAAPAHIRNHPHIAFHVAMIGRDLGISPTAAIQLIDVIGRDDDPNPQLSLSPELLNGQIRRLGLGAIRPLKRTMFECIAGAYGPDGELLGESEFDWADAVVAGLADDRCEPNKHWVPPGGNGRCRCRQGYRTYPKRMLWWRCVPTRAEALTRSGWVTRDKVWAGVEILGFDRETSELAWTEVTDVHDYEAAQTYTIENTRGSFRATATGGHDWITERWDQPGGWQKIPTDRLDSAHGHTRILASAPMRNTPSEISPIDAARLGWVITDGTISWRGKSPSITVSQSKHVDAVRDLFPMAVEDVLDTVVCPDCGSEFRPTKGPIVPRRPEHRFRLNAAESRRLLSAGGIRTKEDAAALPARLDHAGRRAMFTAMMLANGEQFCTGHEAVWDCWVILATMLGHRVSRPVRQRGSIRGRVNSSSVVSVKRLSVEPSMVEPVWCPSTGLGTWVTRIDGQVTITGNSAGFAAQDYFPEAGLGLYCLSTRAEALTRSGWRTHDKLAIGDEILAFNNDTGVCEWTPVRATRVYEAAQTYRVEHARWAVTATAEHRWIMQRKGWKGTPDPGREFRTTDTIRRGGGSVLLAAPAVDEPTLLTDREAAIIGWLLTDGSFRWREDLGRGGAISAAIQQSKHVEAVRSLFHDGEMSERVAVEAGVQVIHGKGHLCREHRVFKLRAAFAKHLLGKVGMRTKADAELAVTRLSSSARKAMFDAMLLANGSDAANGPTGQRHVSFFTGHEPVMRAFLALCSLLGQATGRQRWAGKCWVVTLRRSVGVDAASLTVTPHDVEPVWCPTTDFGTWVARVDGYVFMTGNSPEALGAVVGPDGRPIDPTQVELPDGYGPGPGHGNGQARGLPVDTRADGAELWALQARAWALPDEQKRMLRERREQTPALRTDGGVIPFWQLPDRGLRIAKSLLAGLESQAERGDDGWDRAEALDSVHRFCAAVLTHRMVGWLDPSLGTATENPDSVPPPPRDPEPAGDAPTATQAPLSEEERKAALVTPEIIEWIKTLPGVEVEQLLDQAKVDWAGKTDPEKRMLLALEEADARAGEP